MQYSNLLFNLNDSKEDHPEAGDFPENPENPASISGVRG